MADLDDLSSPWFSLLYKLKQGRHVARQDVIDLIESDLPVIDEAKPLITSIIKGEYKFAKGRKPNELLPISPINKMMLIGWVDMLEEEILNLQDYFNQYKDEVSGMGLADMVKSKAITPRAAAEKIVAQDCDCTERTIQNIRFEVKER